jgi:hypothetical protein
MDDGSYRGVKAVRDLEKDEVLLSIPEPLLLSVRSARRDPDVARAGTNLTDQQLLSVHLLNEVSKGKESSHYVYLRTLPTTFDNFLYLSDADVDSLGSAAAQEAAAAKSTLLDDFRASKVVLAGLNVERRLTTLRAYRWATSCIQSRTMYLGSGDTVGCLTPYGDLHNHTPMLRPITPWTVSRGTDGGDGGDGDDGVEESSAVAGEGYFDEAERRYVLVTRRNVKAGDQVFLTYGGY